MGKYDKSVDKNSPEYCDKKIAGGRSMLLMVLVFTLVNLALLLLDTGTYFLFSIWIPYNMTGIAMVMDDFTIGTFTVAALVISAVILLVYFIAWLLSKKHTGWLTAALILFSLDTVAMIVLSLVLFEEPFSEIVDLVFHIWALVILIQGVRYAGKRKKLENPARPYFGTDPELF